MYFIGNVLSPTLTQPEQHDPTFAFTYGEAQMDMNGIPICMEHDERMQVGTIKQSWNQLDGSKWVVKLLNNDEHQLNKPGYDRDKDVYDYSNND